MSHCIFTGQVRITFLDFCLFSSASASYFLTGMCLALKGVLSGILFSVRERLVCKIEKLFND